VSSVEVSRVMAILDAHSNAEDVRFVRRRLEEADVWLESSETWAIVDLLSSMSQYSASCALQWYLADRVEPGEARDALLFSAGVAAMDARQLDLSRDLIEQMIERSDLSAHYCLYAHVLLQCSAPELALVAAEKAVEIDPQFDEAWFRLGEVRRTLRQLPMALVAFEKAYHADPTRELNLIEYAGAVAMLAVVGVECEQFQRVESLLAAVAARNDNFWAMIYWAQFRWLAGDEAQSERALRVAMQLSPADTLPYTLLATYLLDWRRPRAELDRLLDEVRARAIELAATDPQSVSDWSAAAVYLDKYRNTRE
jgi:tetratricopeptide (TPR) repeat protein